jgi:N-acetylmuramoyl-L-alanine amidase
VAWKKSGGNERPSQEYVIARGDTLSAIAKRYNVSIADLRSANGLNGSVIKVGQRLKIPAS